MRLFGVIGVALNALRLNALRTILAMLGIIIGVGSVIVMVSTGNGARARVDAQIAALGTNTLQITSGSAAPGGVRGGAGTASPFTTEDVIAISTQIDGVAAISGVVPGNATLIYGAINWQSQVNGVDEGYFDVRDWPLEDGRIFSPQEAEAAAKVAIVGRSTATTLFGEDSPVGKMMRIRDIPFEVIGVLVQKGQTGVGGDQDDIVLVPTSTARRRLFGAPRTVPNVVRQISLKVEDVAEMPAVQADIESLLRQRRVRPGASDNFRVQNLAEFVRARAETQSTLSLLLGATALISLVVGGIGIMNIMLVSVTERTREIGLRMAVGARSRDILGQFLIEAVALCGAGGLVGIAAGIGATYLVSRLGTWNVTLDPSVVVIALASSALVGIFFGFYPARMASRLNPIEALRRE
jgi:putative ABC transport system permease protein